MAKARPSKANLRKGPRGRTLPKGGAKAGATPQIRVGSTAGQMSHMKSC